MSLLPVVLSLRVGWFPMSKQSNLLTLSEKWFYMFCIMLISIFLTLQNSDAILVGKFLINLSQCHVATIFARVAWKMCLLARTPQESGKEFLVVLSELKK